MVEENSNVRRFIKVTAEFGWKLIEMLYDDDV